MAKNSNLKIFIARLQIVSLYNQAMVEISPEVSEKIDEKPNTDEESPYQVIIHNDDITPMDFVITVLRQVFLLSGPHAVQVMFTAHIHGFAPVCSLPKNEALRRIHRAHYMARLSGYPLTFTLEKG
jgi:ATP-dependent Clp protease adaptor protein ClpS